MPYRRTAGGLEVLLVHPGGPFWKNKGDGAWSMAKGLLEPGEDPEAAALREFAEETGVLLEGELLYLGSERQPSGKTIHAFAVETDLDAGAIVSNTFELEWPPKSGHIQHFPEVDAAAWFLVDLANTKILPGQRPFLARLIRQIQEQERHR